MRNTFVEAIPGHVDASSTCETEYRRSRSELPSEVGRLLDLGLMVDMCGVRDSSQVPDPVAPAMLDTSGSGNNEVPDPTTQLARTTLNPRGGPALADITNTASVCHQRWADMIDDPDPAGLAAWFARLAPRIAEIMTQCACHRSKSLNLSRIPKFCGVECCLKLVRAELSSF